jgi:hypothetical protein
LPLAYLRRTWKIERTMSKFWWFGFG